jgi:hypothetical protein
LPARAASRFCLAAAVAALAALATAPAAAAQPRAVEGLWTSRGELMARPTSGAAWDALKRAADTAGGPANVADQDSGHDTRTLAAALVAARTGDGAALMRTVDGIRSAIGTEAGGRTLALGRNLPSYVIAADVIGLRRIAPALDARFRFWLAAVRTAPLDGDTLISTHDQRPNNWGTMAGAARMAADLYLGDTADFLRAVYVFKGWLGDRTAHSAFQFGDLSYQADPARPRGINARGTAKGGVSVDGALPDDMRRGCSFQVVPCPTVYPWEALQGALVQAELLSRRGVDAWGWSDSALLRAALYLHRLDLSFGGWWAQSDDTWQPWLLNHAYGPWFRTTSPSSPGKVMGFTDWTHAR